MVAWRSVLPVVVLVAFLVLEEWISIPSCKILPGIDSDEYVETGDGSPEDLKVMMVANLLLLGSEAGFFDLYFRDYYMAKFFRKSFSTLKPDMLVVLGDVSAKGSELTRSKWLDVLNQFHKMLGPFLALPFHVSLGDMDVGECSNLDRKSVNWIARNFPGLDSAGCGAFEISNISFVSLNSVALLCGNNKLRFGVEKVIERESVDLQMVTRATIKVEDKSGRSSETSSNFGWRGNGLTSSSGPVLLLHFPLHRKENSYYKKVVSFKSKVDTSGYGSNILESRGFAGTGLYGLFQTIPPNATEYIFQALKPRVVFSAHTHEFDDYTHSDGTHEITVPAMSWKARSEPGFIAATFLSKNRGVSITYCSVARESHMLIAYASVLVLLLFLAIVANTPRLKWLRQ
ncbi:hypothetical protein SLEP1_g51278 [Rubroshorea leprosula]|uniref:Metallophosphoesterase 1 n=1 Tax=Rubroshorea leprosula TaxID=152421 RepID=A0AAV5M579_9ROSI|nr:hypothetical protein SLEP1_g51278 [Rubroshorea leprosula]